MENKKYKIGFIGIGIMGESMCANVIKGGYSVSVFDINKEQMDKMEKLGAKKSNNISEIPNECEIIIIMVPKSENVESVISELLPNITNKNIIIDMSTISPEVSKSLADKVKAKGSRMIDAPVVKSKAAAISGDLGILVGGDIQTLNEVKPVLKCIGKNIIHMGENGSGLIMKLCHNMLVAQIQNGVNEMLVLAQECNIDIDSFIKAISYGGGQNFYLDGKGPTIKKKDFSPKFPFEHMYKDINLTKELSDNLKLDLPGIKLVKNVYDKGIGENLNKEDFSASFKIVESISKNEHS